MHPTVTKKAKETYKKSKRYHSHLLSAIAAVAPLLVMLDERFGVH
jgi:hypothetical protein